jgi:DMSO reductase anchor subunit
MHERGSVAMWLVILLILIVLGAIMSMGHLGVNTGPTPPAVGVVRVR